MNELIEYRPQPLDHFDPHKAVQTIAAAEAIEKLCRRAKDPEKLYRVIETKLTAQRDVVLWWDKNSSQGMRTDLLPNRDVRKLEDFGLNYMTLSRWRSKLADEKDFIRQLETVAAKMLRTVELSSDQPANYSSESNEWYTPARYIDAAHECLGEIDLDPASCAKANETVQAGRIYTKEDDALNKPWEGRIFLNPPYGTDGGESVAGIFCQKAIDEYRAGNVTEGIILVNSVHSQAWQRPLFNFPFCLVDHRIQFVSGDGEENRNPTFQNMFVYLGRDASKFTHAFREIGYCAIPAATDNP